jgi:hypothetical protein
LSQALEEIALEFFEDQIAEDPNAAFPRIKEGQNVVFRRTGDAVVDQWEEQLAQGKEVDFTEGMDAETKALLAGLKRASKKRQGNAPEEEFSDTYTRKVSDAG